MKEQTLETARLVLASSANKPLLQFFEERLEDTLASLVNCNEQTFRQFQGRALECQDIIKLLKSVRT